MKRSGPLKRHKALTPKSPLRRLTELTRQAWDRKPSVPKPKRRRSAVPPATRDLLWHRSSGLCELGLDGCWRRATDPHHRITCKAGGRHRAARVRHDRLSNLLAGCRHCHDAVTSAHGPRLEEYRDTGLVLEEWQEPAEVPVTSPALLWLYGGPVLLGDHGAVTVLDLSPLDPPEVSDV